MQACMSLFSESNANTETKDCLDVYNNGETKSGVYTVYPGGTPIDVLCDMTTDGGGWSVSRKLLYKEVIFW